MDTTTDYYQAVKKPIPVEVRAATPQDDFLIRNHEGVKIHNILGVFAYGEVYPHYYVLRLEGGEEFPLHKDEFEKNYEWVSQG